MIFFFRQDCVDEAERLARISDVVPRMIVHALLGTQHKHMDEEHGGGRPFWPGPEIPSTAH